MDAKCTIVNLICEEYNHNTSEPKNTTGRFEKSKVSRDARIGERKFACSR
jgi:hypothetical protein